MSVFTSTRQFCNKCMHSIDTSWSSKRLLENSPPLPKKVKPLALFQLSVTFNPACNSRHALRVRRAQPDRRGEFDDLVALLLDQIPINRLAQCRA